MNKEVSIVLSAERRNYRKLAQEWVGLTDEQMIGMDVHHNPPRSQGGRNIPEHLFIYHETLHSAVHGDNFTKWARMGGHLGGHHRNPNGGKVSGPLTRDNKQGIFDPQNKEKLREASRKNGAKRVQQMKQEGYPGLGRSFEAASAAGKKGQEKTNSQKWKCLVTGHISTSGPLTSFQRKRDIDTSLRERLL